MNDPNVIPEPMAEHDHLDDYEAHLQRGPLPVVTPPGEAKGMLPGIAGVGMFLLFISMTGAFLAATGAYPGSSKYVVLGISTMILVGVFGLLRLRRWGWALSTGGCLFMSVGYFLLSRVMKEPRMMVMGFFMLVFFLYLSRTEVRERLR